MAVLIACIAGVFQARAAAPCAMPCSGCDPEAWGLAGKTGYEREIDRECDCDTGICAVSYSYRCAAGYFGTPSGCATGSCASATGCTSCADATGNSSFTVAAGDDKTINDCCSLPSTPISDTKGVFDYGGTCCYAG